MAKVSVVYKNDIAKITIKLKYIIDFNSDYFHISILDSIKSFFRDNDGSNTLKLRIDKNNINDYIDKDTKTTGLNIYSKDEHTLCIELHALMNDDKGFTVCEVIGDIPNPDDHTEVDVFSTNVTLFPKLVQDDIRLKFETDCIYDPQLSNTNRRPDYEWTNVANSKDYMYVNTSAGRTNVGTVTKNGIEQSDKHNENYVPQYIVETSAYVPKSFSSIEYNGQHYSLDFDYANLSSYITDGLSNNSITYDLLDAKDCVYTFKDKSKIDCKCRTIRQYISTDTPNTLLKNKLSLDMNLLLKPVSDTEII